MTLASVMKTMVRSVDLKKIGVTVRNTRQTRTGGILLEVDLPKSADMLAEKVRQATADKARVTQGKRRSSILLLGMPSWADEADVRGGLATLGIASSEATKILLKGGRDGRDYGTALVSVPYDAAIKVAKAEFVVVG